MTGDSAGPERHHGDRLASALRVALAHVPGTFVERWEIEALLGEHDARRSAQDDPGNW
jgi:hypothetical protein